jgi:cytochrome c oxidase cbb3-type subunit 3
MNNQLIKYILSGVFVSFLSVTAMAQETATEVVEKPMNWSWLPYALTVTAIILLITILLFSSVINSLSRRVEEHSKKIAPFIIFTMLFASNEAFAGEAAKSNATTYMSNIMLYVILIGVILLEIMVLAYLYRNIKVLLNVIAPSAASEQSKESIIDWQAIWKKIGGLKPMEQEADLRMNDHIYDGTIQELDNRMPPWLSFIFQSTIVFAVIYLFLYQYSNWGPDPVREYKAEVAMASIKKAEYLDKQANSVDENSVTVLTDEASLSAGATVYKTNCVACHGDKGQGGVGPNFADEYWINGGSIKSIFKTITYGVEAKGMRSWKNDLLPSDIQKVASYIKSLKGTNPPGGKAPQGDLYKEEATDAPAATTTTAAPPATEVKTK